MHGGLEKSRRWILLLHRIHLIHPRNIWVPGAVRWVSIWFGKFPIPGAMLLLLDSNFVALWVGKIQTLDFPASSDSSISSSQYLGSRSVPVDQYLVQKIPDSCSYGIVFGFEF